MDCLTAELSGGQWLREETGRPQSPNEKTNKTPLFPEANLRVNSPHLGIHPSSHPFSYKQSGVEGFFLSLRKKKEKGGSEYVVGPICPGVSRLEVLTLTLLEDGGLLTEPGSALVWTLGALQLQ